MAWVPYDAYMESLFEQNTNQVVDWDDNSTTTVKIALVTSSYTPNRAGHDFWDDASANEVSGTNYTAGGNEVASKTCAVASNVVTVDAADPATWSQSGSGFSNARYAILYKDTGTASTSVLIAYADFGSDKGNVSGDLTVELDTDGIFTCSAA